MQSNRTRAASIRSGGVLEPRTRTGRVRLGCGCFLLVVLLITFAGMLGGQSAAPTPTPTAAADWARPVAVGTTVVRVVYAPTPQAGAGPSAPAIGPAFEAAARGYFDGEFRSSTVEGSTGTVDYELAGVWGGEDIAAQAGDALAEFASKAFALPGLEAVRLRATAQFKDLRGQPAHGPAVTLTLTRALASRMDLSKIQARDLYRAIGSWEADPSLRPAVLSFVRGG
jgi:hypothetical protein